MTFAELKAILCGTDGTQGIIQDDQYYSAIGDYINAVVSAVAAGVRMPNGIITPPLPDLYTMDTVQTVADTPYTSMPSDYQRKLFMVADAIGDKVRSPRGGSYYAFSLFLREARRKDLAQSGTIDMVCVKGNKLYYQDIPEAGTTLTLHYYRLPVPMVADDDEPDGIPEHLQTRIIQHGVCRDIFGHGIEVGLGERKENYNYHNAKFYEALTDLVDFVGIDAEPEYYGDANDWCEW